MAKLNNRDDIILQIKEYYKKIKKINDSRQNKFDEKYECKFKQYNVS